VQSKGENNGKGKERQVANISKMKEENTRKSVSTAHKFQKRPSQLLLYIGCFHTPYMQSLCLKTFHQTEKGSIPPIACLSQVQIAPPGLISPTLLAVASLGSLKHHLAKTGKK
jgi:hypothetical protein